jgi:hypothetical protein
MSLRGPVRPVKDKAMYLCVICRFLVELDDAIAPTTHAHCVCLSCFARETETARSMGPILRGEVSAVLATA